MRGGGGRGGGFCPVTFQLHNDHSSIDTSTMHTLSLLDLTRGTISDALIASYV